MDKYKVHLILPTNASVVGNAEMTDYKGYCVWGQDTDNGPATTSSNWYMDLVGMSQDWGRDAQETLDKTMIAQSVTMASKELCMTWLARHRLHMCGRTEAHEGDERGEYTSVCLCIGKAIIIIAKTTFKYWSAFSVVSVYVESIRARYSWHLLYRVPN